MSEHDAHFVLVTETGDLEPSLLTLASEQVWSRPDLFLPQFEALVSVKSTSYTRFTQAKGF